MVAAPTTRRTSQHKPALAVFSAVGSAWVFVLVTLGAFTTSIGAGMAFPDWPLSNGSINPAGWLENLSMFAEHSHRLTGMTMGLITIAMAAWLWLREERAWLRHLGAWALGIVILQGLIGGQRVTLDAMTVPGFQMSLGQMLRIPHGILAQIYVCVLIAIAVASSKAWIERSAPIGPTSRKLGVICCVLLLLQLAIAATMRHNAAGLAIPTFPYSTPDQHWLPATWDFRIAIHFAHRVMAIVVGAALVVFAVVIQRDRAATATMRAAGWSLVALVVLQITLGAEIIWTFRKPEMTTGHVVVGALTLAVTFWVTWFAHRDLVERATVGELGAVAHPGGRVTPHNA